MIEDFFFIPKYNINESMKLMDIEDEFFCFRIL